TFVARMPRNAPMRFTTEGGRPPRTTAAISRSFSSGYDLKTTDICLQNIDNCLEGQRQLARVPVVRALGTHRVRLPANRPPREAPSSHSITYLLCSRGHWGSYSARVTWSRVR